jgi:5'-3' exonuclease
VTHRILLDVSSLTYRAFFSMPDSVTAPDGRPINAVYGYLDMVTRLIASRRPDEVVHVYDHDWRPVARVDIFAGYKATRPEEPEAITTQFELLRSVLDRTGTLQAQTEGWEAEDAIGAFAVEADEPDLVEVVSGDRDLIQVVRDPVVKLLYTLRGVSELAEYDEAGVLAKYGVPAARYVDFAILRGDPSDALPGVKGVGEKTARELVNAYATLDELLEAAATPLVRDGPLKGKTSLKAKLLDAREYIDAMRRLVPVNATAPLSVWSGERDDAALTTMGEELGLKGPIQRLLAALDSAGTG